MKKGIITTYALVFGTIFLILLGGLFGFILLQLRYSAQRVAWNESLEIAEAGINFYHWCLNNGVEAKCQTERGFQDLAGNLIGTSTIEITSSVSCTTTTSRQITSTGYTKDFPDLKRKVSVLYGRTSGAKYSYILNDNVWVGADHEIRGPYHSNGGIRFDGENQSIVTSALNNWICTCSFGCKALGCLSYSCSSPCIWDGTNCTCPGIFTTTLNSNPDLFSFPIPPFDFAGITVDLAEMKKLTQEGYGLYFGPSGGKGYHIIFKEDRSIDVWKVTSVTMLDEICTVVGSKVICDEGTCEPECPQCVGGKCVVKDPVIKTEEPVGTGNYKIPEGCGLVFFEDDLWVGRVDVGSKIKGKITVVSADLITPGKETNVWLQGNIGYTIKDGSDGLTVIGQHNNLIGLYSPDVMELRGIFIAQTGFFGRNHYPCEKYSPYCKREKLEIYGSIISKSRVGTKWTSGGQYVSGYEKRETYFDSNLVYNPPPFTPFIEPDFKILNWEEAE